MLPRMGRPLFAGSAIALKCRQLTFSAPWFSSTAGKRQFQEVYFAPTAPNGFTTAVPYSITRTTRDAMQTALCLLDRKDRNDYLLGHPQRLNSANTIFYLISMSQCSSGIPQADAANGHTIQVFKFKPWIDVRPHYRSSGTNSPEETVAQRTGGVRDCRHVN
jgi:hypothetical protein